MAQYKTKYADALKRNKIKFTDLQPAARESYDTAVSVEASLHELYEELKDVKGDERTSVNESIANIETQLAILDASLVKKIDGHHKAVERVAAMQVGRANAKAAKAAAGIIVEPIVEPVPEPLPEPIVEPIVEPVIEPVVEEPAVISTDPEEPKKKSSAWAWIAGIAGIAIFGVVGYYVNKDHLPSFGGKSKKRF